MPDTPLENLIAKLFIARSDVRAIQIQGGAYNKQLTKFTRQSIQDHLARKITYGHYLLDTDSTCKIMAFDLDLDTTGRLPETTDWDGVYCDFNPREAWLDRRHPARSYMKYALKSLAWRIKRCIDDLEIPSAVTYTGAKGLHVYGFTGRIPAKYIRSVMSTVVEDLNLEPFRGNLFFKSTAQSQDSIITVETFPKQDTLEPGGFGNLMRLPLGRNLKSNDPTFFLDMENTVMSEWVRADALAELTRVDQELSREAVS